MAIPVILAETITVTGFLVVAHIAMIFGMVNPEIVNGMAGMPGMK
ncbi:DUF6803 family protein [Paenibacillus wynnii]|nr:DUF6803 family protein [Paenibacillus wynnii]